MNKVVLGLIIVLGLILVLVLGVRLTGGFPADCMPKIVDSFDPMDWVYAVFGKKCVTY